MSKPETTGWRPIEGAPLCNMVVWLRDQSGVEALGYRARFTDAGWAVKGTRMPIRPVHWKPAPEHQT